MSSPLGWTDAIGSAHGAAQLILDPHVQTAIWAVALAIACALVMIIAEMVKRHDTDPASSNRNDRKKPR